MNIIIGKEDAEKMEGKYTFPVLPLETMKWKSNPELPAKTTAYCLDRKHTNYRNEQD